MFKRASDQVLDHLHQHYRPFQDLMIPTLLRSENVLRILKLKKGETFLLHSGNIPDYFYVIQGRVEVVREESHSIIDAKDHLGLLYFIPANQVELEIKALMDSIVVHADGESLADLISWDQLARCSALCGNRDEEFSLDCIRRTKAFRNLSFEAVEEVFRRLIRLEVAEGTEVVRQGQMGDAYYLILSGKAEVWRQEINDDQQKLVATLVKGDAFGEESLITKGVCNATVKMITDGVLLKLVKADFDHLIATPLIRHVPPDEANVLIKNGSQVLDVRYKEEFDEGHVPGSLLVPLPELRARQIELNPDKTYLVMCASGRRASVGAMLLRQFNVKDACVIQGGMRDWPFDRKIDY
ncbi:MAG: cyclic nucleotide-binding domain-containing protein [Magnetococcales bacterium]|nr:cyclic nucleotide-binding domain-containing protein [Magnetococcales bacterium]MBF0148534.1 cyclic nucleotide-binding domain-containing protein [Magnetococcales bacterium]MBF0172655.1 cyclic nucleotide-binding domain-containing protein [Magnetococcales bacterium]MBF0346499.1 cyclic nucleotide-binding domain-containing protein [Magnetococcales bacterium]